MRNIITTLMIGALSVATVTATTRTINPMQSRMRSVAQVERSEKSVSPTTLKKAKAQQPKAKISRTELDKKASMKAPAKKAAEVKVLYNDPFAALTEGSEEDPQWIFVDGEGNIPEDIIGEANYGFGGDGLAQAGGALYIYFQDEEGFMWSPDMPGGGVIRVSFEAKSTNPASDDVIYVGATDYYDLLDAKYGMLSPEWTKYSMDLDCTGASSADDVYFQLFAYYEDDIIVRNMKVESLTAAVDAPTAYEATDYTGTSFKASWSDVEGADYYKIYVAEFDYEEDYLIEPFIIDGAKVESTSYTVEGIKPGSIYYYWVVASNSEGDSFNSNKVEVAKLLPVTGLTGTITESGFTLKWDAVPGANYYAVTVNSLFSPKVDSDFIIANGDFSGIKSSGTIDEPEEDPVDIVKAYPEMPNWNFILPATVPGAVGFLDDPFFAMFGIAGQLESEVFDLSGIKDGKVSISTSMASGKSNTVEFLTAKQDEEGDWVIFDSTRFKLSPTFNKYDIDLKVPTDSEMLFACWIDDDDYEYDGSVMFANMKVSGNVAAGSSVGIPYAAEETEETSIDIAAPMGEGNEYEVTVMPLKVDLEYGDIIIAGEASAPINSSSFSGVENVTAGTDFNAPVEFFNLQGIRISNPSKGQVVIRRQGNDARAIIVK